MAKKYMYSELEMKQIARSKTLAELFEVIFEYSMNILSKSTGSTAGFVFINCQ